MNFRARSLVVLGSLVLALGSARLVDARCMRAPPEVPVLLTPTSAPLPADTVLVATLARPAWDQQPTAWTGADGVFPANLALERNGVRIALRVEPLEPALARLVPAHAPTPGRWQLVGLPAPVALEFTAAHAPPIAPPPAPRDVTYTERQVSTPRAVTATARHVALRLGAGFAPGDYLALAADWVHAGAPTHAGSFARFDAASPASALAVAPVDTVALYDYTPSHCGAGLPTGQQAPAAGDAVRLTWVDRYGRVVPVAAAVPIAR